MAIADAKRKLYEYLRDGFPWVVGAGIKAENNIQFIVIYLSSGSHDAFKSIPSEYEGYLVKPEVSGTITALG